MSEYNTPPVTAPHVPNYLIASIFLTLCCCLPLGIPAIIFSSMASSHLAAGNYAAASDASNKAKLFLVDIKDFDGVLQTAGFAACDSDLFFVASDLFFKFFYFIAMVFNILFYFIYRLSKRAARKI